MEGIVKYVTRNVWYEECTSDHWRSDVHPRRYTCTYAVLYNGDEVEIDEDDIRDFYDCYNLTANVIQGLNDDLRNECIEYYEDDDGDYYLDGCLEDYI